MKWINVNKFIALIKDKNNESGEKYMCPLPKCLHLEPTLDQMRTHMRLSHTDKDVEDFDRKAQHFAKTGELL